MHHSHPSVRHNESHFSFYFCQQASIKGNNVASNSIKEDMELDDNAHSGATDVLVKDEDVCVLRPNSPRGLVVFHRYLERFHDQITREGLVLGSGLRTGTRSINHPLIFFRAPSRNSAGHNLRPTLLDISRNYEPCQINAIGYQSEL